MPLLTTRPHQAAEEDSIYQKETEYLETTPAGNIVVGFDNYTKGTGNAAAARRKTGLTETNRVFSRSSVSYNANNVCPPSPPSPPMAWFGFLALFVGADDGFALLTTQDAQTPASSNSTPGGSLAPTPMSTSFLGGGGGNKEVGSGAPTPTSATGKVSGASKKKKAPGAAGKAAAAAAAAGEDSEDSREKKVRTNFGAARK